jgi:hypothetical protein
MLLLGRRKESWRKRYHCYKQVCICTNSYIINYYILEEYGVAPCFKRLKGRKGIECHTSPYRLKKDAINLLYFI